MKQFVKGVIRRVLRPIANSALDYDRVVHELDRIGQEVRLLLKPAGQQPHPIVVKCFQDRPDGAHL